MMANKQKYKWAIFCAMLMGVILVVVTGCGSLLGEKRTLKKQLDLAEKYEKEAEYDKAKAVLKKAISIDPECVEAYLELIDVYEKNGEAELALEIAQKGYAFTGDELLYANAKVIEKRSSEREKGIVAGDEKKEIPDEKKLLECFQNFSTWAGIQMFYNKIEFDKLDCDIRVAIAAFDSVERTTNHEYTENQQYIIVTNEQMVKSMRDLFGEEYTPAPISEFIQDNSNILVDNKGSVNVKVGEWGMVVPKCEIVSVEMADASDPMFYSKKSYSTSEFYVTIRYYPYDMEKGEEIDGVSYICQLTCISDEESWYGFVIKDMSGEVE